MQRIFQEGEEVVHKSDRLHRMTVVAYTNDGKVVCRWKVKDGFKSEQFYEAELEVWVPQPGAFVFGPGPRPF
jgi:uncharacterized protein YodC (DUF2158 family)